MTDNLDEFSRIRHALMELQDEFAGEFHWSADNFASGPVITIRIDTNSEVVQLFEDARQLFA